MQDRVTTTDGLHPHSISSMGESINTRETCMLTSISFVSYHKEIWDRGGQKYPPPPPIYFPGKSGRDKTRWPKTEIGNEISYRYLRSTRAWWGNRSRLEPSPAELPFQMPTRDTSREKNEDLVDSPLHRQRKTASEEKFPQVEEIYERNQCKKGYRIDNGRGWQRERSRGG